MTGNIKAFKINPDIVYDTIDGEVILLDIENGNYYQLKNEAVRVWEAIENKKIISVSQIAESLSKNSGYSPDEILQSIGNFIDQLHAEHILLEAKGSGVKNEHKNLSRKKGGGIEHKYPVPVLLKYTDMQSILLLDPIHDTGSDGWPNKKRETINKT
ncbi:MAG: PqqD family protein [Candidatus Levyibacteriota bacterium]